MNTYVDVPLGHYYFLNSCLTKKTGAPIRPTPIAEILINLFKYHGVLIKAMQLDVSATPRYFTTEALSSYGPRTYHEPDPLRR